MEAVLKRGSSFHGGLLMATVAVCAILLPHLAWPWYLLMPLLAYATVVLTVPPLRRTVPSLRPGHLGGAPLVYAAVLSLATMAVLVGFHVWFSPEVTALAKRLPVAAFGSLILAGLCFSVLNAAQEEIVFRGVLWKAITDEWNEPVALAVTAVLFGLGHLNGYPPGPIGAALAGLYGIALGLLRWWTGGLGLALVCHVVADATIFALLWWSEAFGE